MHPGPAGTYAGQARLRAVIGQIAITLIIVWLAAPSVAANLEQHLLIPLRNVLISGDNSGDFLAFYSAGRLYKTADVANGDTSSPYNLALLRQAQLEILPHFNADPDWKDNPHRVLPFRNPPSFLPVVGFLATYPFPLAFVIATLLELLLLGGLLIVTARVASTHTRPLSAVITWVAVVLASRAVWHVLEFAQLPSCIIAAAFAGGILLLRAERPIWSGMIFSFMCLKFVYLFPLIIFLAVWRKWQALGSLFAGCVVLFLLSVSIVGPSGMGRYINVLRVLTSVSSENDYYYNAYEHMYNVRSVFESDPVSLWFSSDQRWAILIVLVVVLWIVAGVLWSIAYRSPAPWMPDAAIMLLAVIMLLSSLHAHVQDTILLLPALAHVAGRCWSKWPNPLFSVISGGVLLLLSRLLYHIDTRDYSIHRVWLLNRGTFLLSGLFMLILLAIVAERLARGRPRLRGWPTSMMRSIQGAVAPAGTPSGSGRAIGVMITLLAVAALIYLAIAVRPDKLIARLGVDSRDPDVTASIQASETPGVDLARGLASYPGAQGAR
jgi:hypothetical protein